MKINFIHLGVVAALIGSSCPVKVTAATELPSGALLRMEFAGWKSISGSTNAKVLREVGSLESSQVVFGLMLDKLAGTPARIWKETVPANATNQTALIRSVLRDLAYYPTLIHVEGTTEEPVFVVAARVPDERAKLWSTNLWRVASVWKLGQPEASGSGWQMALADSKATMGVRQAEDWTVFTAGFNADAVGEKVAAKLAAAQASEYPAGGDFLRVEADWPRLKDWTPFFAPYPILPMTMRVNAESDYVRTLAEFISASPIHLAHDAWKIPTNIISEPLVSFTAVRGARPFLREMKLVRDLELDPVPDQVVVWGQRIMNGQTMIAVPAENADRRMTSLASNLPSAIISRMNGQSTGNIYWKSNQFELGWAGLPVILPFARALQTNGQQYLVAGLFPYLMETNPPPPELYQQLFEQEDVLYYDWEITEHRLIHNRHYYQMIDIFSDRHTIKTDAPVFVWMSDVHARLGNAVTEGRMDGPRKIRFSRRSHLGLTGFELVTFMRWLHSDGFPLTYDPQPAIVIPEHLRALQKKEGGSRPRGATP